MRWALVLTLVAGVAQGQWATSTPRPTPRPTYPPAPTRTATPRPTSTPSAQATSTPSPQRTPTPGTLPTPHAGLNYYLVPLVPVLTPKVGESLRYADGTPIYLTVRLASGEIKATIVRVDP